MPMKVYEQMIEQATSLVNEINYQSTTMDEAQVMRDWCRTGGKIVINGEVVDTDASYEMCAGHGTIFPFLVEEFIPSALVRVYDEEQVKRKRVVFRYSDYEFDIITQKDGKTSFSGSCYGKQRKILILLDFFAKNFGQGGIWITQPAVNCSAFKRSRVVDGDYVRDVEISVGINDTLIIKEKYILNGFKKMTPDGRVVDDDPPNRDDKGIVEFNTTFELAVNSDDKVVINNFSCDKDVRNPELYEIFDPEMYQHHESSGPKVHALVSGEIVEDFPSDQAHNPQEREGFFETMLKHMRGFLQRIIDRFNSNAQTIPPQAAIEQQEAQEHQSLGASMFSILAGIYTGIIGFFSDLFASIGSFFC